MLHSLLIALSLLTSPAKAIIGGDPLDLSRSVAHVTVSIASPESRALCSGVLIAQNAVLTSAQCVYRQDPRRLFVTFGFNANASTIYRGVTATYVPQQYLPYSAELPAFRNAWDIAIVFFTGSLPRPYRIADLVAGSPLLAQEAIEIAGHGGTGFGPDAPGVGLLRGCRTTVAAPAFSYSEFSTISTGPCAVSARDAGGPVYRVLGNNVYVFGLHAWAWPSDGVSPGYNVHTRVGTYTPWIQAILLNP